MMPFMYQPATMVWPSIETKLKAKAETAGTPASATDVLQATRDSVRAIMMIRAYRMRGHLHAKLDPLGIAAPVEDYKELSPEAYGFTEADFDRKIFIDNVLGLEFATIQSSLALREVKTSSRIAIPKGSVTNVQYRVFSDDCTNSSSIEC